MLALQNSTLKPYIFKLVLSDFTVTRKAAFCFCCLTAGTAIWRNIYEKVRHDFLSSIYFLRTNWNSTLQDVWDNIHLCVEPNHTGQPLVIFLQQSPSRKKKTDTVICLSFFNDIYQVFKVSVNKSVAMMCSLLFLRNAKQGVRTFQYSHVFLFIYF